MKRIQGKIKRYQISSGIIMGSINEYGFGLIQMQLSNGYYNTVFEKSKLLKWFPDIIGLLRVFGLSSGRTVQNPCRD